MPRSMQIDTTDVGPDDVCRPRPLLLEARHAAEDAVYSVRAWAYDIRWRAVAIAVCTAIIAFLQADWTVFTASLTGLVILLVPHVDPDVAHALIETVLIKYRIIPRPPNEDLFKPPAPRRGRIES